MMFCPHIGFVGIILYGDRFFLKIGLDGLDAFFKADVVFDFLLAILAMHLWLGCQDYGLDVLG